MPLLSSAELEDLRTDAETALSDACVILRDTVAADDFSAHGSLTTGTAGTVACRVRASQLTPQERAVLGLQEQAQRTFAITLPHDADVRGTDRIGYGGRVFQVTGPTTQVTDTVVTRVFAYESE